MSIVTMKTLRKLSEKCCHKCDYDEAEGGLFCHCPECCLWITSRLWELTHGFRKDFDSEIRRLK